MNTLILRAMDRLSKTFKKQTWSFGELIKETLFVNAEIINCLMMTNTLLTLKND